MRAREKLLQGARSNQFPTTHEICGRVRSLNRIETHTNSVSLQILGAKSQHSVVRIPFGITSP